MTNWGSPVVPPYLARICSVNTGLPVWLARPKPEQLTAVFIIFWCSLSVNIKK